MNRLAAVVAAMGAAVAAVLVTEAGPALAAETTARSVALVLVPDLDWEHAPPALDGFAKANLSLRSAPPDSDVLDSYLTLSKGSRSGAPAAGFEVAIGDIGGQVPLRDWARLRAHDESLHYKGRLGALGRALAEGERRYAVVVDDPHAAVVGATTSGLVPRVARGGPVAIGALRAEGYGQLVVQTSTPGLSAALAATSGSCAIVASVSSPDRSRHLGVLATSPECGLGTGGLSSATTRQRSLATLPDVTATFLSRQGVARDPSMGGTPVKAAAEIGSQELARRDQRAHNADRARTPLVWLFIVAHAAGALVVARRPTLRLLVACALLAVPPASFLIMAMPWWRWGVAGGLLAVIPLAAVLAALALRIGRRHGAPAAVWVLAGVGAVVIGVDAAFGGALEIDAPFGNSPVTAGRFYGVGNIGFALLAASLLVAGAIALDRRGRAVWPWVAGALAAGVVLDGAPWFGADVGGVLAAVPAFAVLLLAWRSGRPPWRGLALATAGAGAVVVLLALVDSTSHLGRVLSADDVADAVARKAPRAITSIKRHMVLLVPVGLLALLAVRPRLDDRPALRAGAWALATLAVLGTALNDSGFLVAAAVVAVAWPAFVALAPPYQNSYQDRVPWASDTDAHGTRDRDDTEMTPR